MKKSHSLTEIRAKRSELPDVLVIQQAFAGNIAQGAHTAFWLCIKVSVLSEIEQEKDSHTTTLLGSVLNTNWGGRTEHAPRGYKAMPCSEYDLIKNLDLAKKIIAMYKTFQDDYIWSYIDLKEESLTNE